MSILDSLFDVSIYRQMYVESNCRSIIPRIYSTMDKNGFFVHIDDDTFVCDAPSDKYYPYQFVCCVLVFFFCWVPLCYCPRRTIRYSRSKTQTIYYSLSSKGRFFCRMPRTTTDCCCSFERGYIMVCTIWYSYWNFLLTNSDSGCFVSATTKDFQNCFTQHTQPLFSCHNAICENSSRHQNIAQPCRHP